MLPLEDHVTSLLGLMLPLERLQIFRIDRLQGLFPKTMLDLAISAAYFVIRQGYCAIRLPYYPGDNLPVSVYVFPPWEQSIPTLGTKHSALC